MALYTGQGKLHSSTMKTLDYIVHQAEFIGENLRNVSDYLDAAKRIGVDAVFLPEDVQKQIDDVKSKISYAINTLSNKTEENSKQIQEGIDGM